MRLVYNYIFKMKFFILLIFIINYSYAQDAAAETVVPAFNISTSFGDLILGVA